MGLFGISKGLKIFKGEGSNTEVDVVTLAGDPREVEPEVNYAKGSIGLGDDGVTYRKTGTDIQDWDSITDIEGGGLKWVTSLDSNDADLTLEEGNGYIINGNSSYTLNFPTAPSQGDRIGFVTLGNLETNNVTIATGSEFIHGENIDAILDLNYAYIEYIYSGDINVGWVLSNVDEHQALEAVQGFVGNTNNSDPAVPEFSEGNVIGVNEDLQSAIDKLDIEAADVQNFIGKDGTLDDLPNFTEREEDVDPAYSVSSGFLSDDDDLELSTAKLDYAIQQVKAVAETGVNWQAMLHVATEDPDLVDGSTQTEFSDDEGAKVPTEDFVDGIKALNTDTQMIHTFDGTAWDAGVPLEVNQAVAVKHDLTDSPGTAEQGGAFMNNDSGTAVKIMDFDFETANQIAMSDEWKAVASDGTGGTFPLATDTIQEAANKNAQTSYNNRTILGTPEESTNLGNTGLINVTDNTDVATAINELDEAIGKAEVTASVGSDATTTVRSAVSGEYVKVDVVITDSTSNSYMSSLTIANDGSGNVDFTEKDILILGNYLDIELSVADNAGDFDISVTNNSGSSIDVKTVV